MNTELQRHRVKLIQLLKEREMLRTQYGRHSSRARILDGDIRSAAQAYAIERRRMMHTTLKALKAEWGKRLGWDESDFRQ